MWNQPFECSAADTFLSSIRAPITRAAGVPGFLSEVVLAGSMGQLVALR
jgi:hypothetical protein